MRIFLLMLFLFFFFLFASCNSSQKPINKYTHEVGFRKKTGFWVENLSSDLGDLQEKGKYRNGKKVGLWITSFGDKIYQKEKFRKNTSKVKMYQENGKLKQKGNTETKISEDEGHWFYSGKWKYYDVKGKHIYTKIYVEGTPIDSIFIKKSD